MPVIIGERDAANFSSILPETNDQRIHLNVRVVSFQKKGHPSLAPIPPHKHKRGCPAKGFIVLFHLIDPILKRLRHPPPCRVQVKTIHNWQHDHDQKNTTPITPKKISKRKQAGSWRVLTRLPH